MEIKRRYRPLIAGLSAVRKVDGPRSVLSVIGNKKCACVALRYGILISQAIKWQGIRYVYSYLHNEMKIALLGYGKMGHEIEKVAIDRGHEIVATIDNDEEWASKAAALRTADVAIDFSTPATAVGNIDRCFALHLPVVVGTTGWYDQLDAKIRECEEKGESLFVASNFSIGVNILFDLNRRLAKLMNRYGNYSGSITETHHIHKLDAPSGTAISLAKGIVGNIDRLAGWELDEGKAIPQEKLPIKAIREGEVPGIHEVVYDSEVDTIKIYHSAKSRKGFAVGAVIAAEYLKGKKGYHTMEEMMD